MASLDDKKLHLLGLLYAQDTHGYGLSRQLGLPNNVVQIRKGNAYRLLAKMEREGLVSHVEEQDSPRPPRMVYSLTSAGWDEFLRLLQERMGEFEPLEYPFGVPLNFISLLDAEDALALLIPRQEHLAEHIEALKNDGDDVLAMHPGINFMLIQAELEHEFVNRIVEGLKESVKQDARRKHERVHRRRERRPRIYLREHLDPEAGQAG